MNPLEKAIMINNEGVHRLNFGNISGALHAFQSAVVVMKEAAVSHAEYPALPNDRNDCSLWGVEPRPGNLVGLQNEHCYVFTRPLLIPTDVKISTPEELDSFVLTSSAIVIFNFALASHQFGNISGQQAPLRRAGRLYDLTLKILVRGENHYHHMHAILQCLALNNLAQLCYDQCDYAKSQTCIETMYDLVATTDCLDSHLNEHEAAEIMLNIVHLQPPTVARAA